MRGDCCPNAAAWSFIVLATNPPSKDQDYFALDPRRLSVLGVSRRSYWVGGFLGNGVGHSTGCACDSATSSLFTPAYPRRG